MRIAPDVGVVDLGVLAPRARQAAATAIDFDRFPDADGQLNTADDIIPGPFTNLTTDLGLTVANGTVLQGPVFDGNPANHFLASSPITASLTVPVLALSVGSYS